MTAPLDAPGEWTELRRRTCRAGGSPSAEPFADHLVRPRVGRRPAARCGCCSATAPSGVHRPRRRAPRRRARRQPGVDRRRRCASCTSRSPRRRRSTRSDVATGERTLLKQTPAPNVDLSQLRRQPRVGDGAGRHPRARRRRPPRRRRSPTAPHRAWSTATAATSSSMPPWFCRRRGCRCSTAAWSWALVHPRGGGELGRRWYLDGKLLHKRNTFTDTIACGEHLVAAGWAAPRPGRASAAAAPAGCSSARA